jgi:hypothetical protein
MAFNIKPLEIQQEKNIWKRIWHSKQVRKTFIYMFFGAIFSVAISFFSEGMSFESVPGNEIFHSAMIGAFIGIFITNSPCARGKC